MSTVYNLPNYLERYFEYKHAKSRKRDNWTFQGEQGWNIGPAINH